MQPRTLECVLKHTGDAETGHVHTVLCRGQLVAGTAHTLKDAVKPFVDQPGRLVVDMAEVSYVDSMGLGTLVGLKTAAQGHCTIEFHNLSDRVQELLRFTHLTDILKA